MRTANLARPRSTKQSHTHIRVKVRFDESLLLCVSLCRGRAVPRPKRISACNTYQAQSMSSRVLPGGATKRLVKARSRGGRTLSRTSPIHACPTRCCAVWEPYRSSTMECRTERPWPGCIRHGLYLKQYTGGCVCCAGKGCEVSPNRTSQRHHGQHTRFRL